MRLTNDELVLIWDALEILSPDDPRGRNLLAARVSAELVYPGGVRFERTVEIPTGERLSVYRDDGGGCFGIDASYIAQEAGPTWNPLTGVVFDPEKAES